MTINKFRDIVDGKKQLNEDATTECGMMGEMPPAPPLTMNLSVSAQGISNIKDVLNLINMHDGHLDHSAVATTVATPITTPATPLTPANPIDDIVKKAGLPDREKSKIIDDDENEGFIGSTLGAAAGALTPIPGGARIGAAIGGAAQDAMSDDENEAFDNMPDEEYQDTDYMIKDLSGGLGHSQKMSPKGYRNSDNPLSMHSETVDTIKDRLIREYQEFNEGPKGYDSMGNPLGGGYDERHPPTRKPSKAEFKKSSQADNERWAKKFAKAASANVNKSPAPAVGYDVIVDGKVYETLRNKEVAMRIAAALHAEGKHVTVRSHGS